MLSSAVNAFAGHVSIANTRCVFSSLKRRPPNAGRMEDLLDLLGPLDAIFPPSAGRLYASLFRKSIKSRNLKISSMAHAHLTKSGLGSEPLVSNVLLNVYAKAGRLWECGKLFDEMPLKDNVSWCTLISGCVARGLDLEAFELLKRAYVHGLKPNQFVISAILKGCGNSENPALGIQVHAAAIKIGLTFDSFVEVGLISLYAKHGAITEAIKLFYEIPVKGLASWNAMISGYVHQGLFSEAIDLSRAMCRVGFVLDSVALRVVASAGTSLGMIIFCENLLSYSIKVGLDADNFIVVELVKLLSKLGEVESIGKLVARVRKPEACLYALTITGFHVNGRRSEALKHAEELLKANLSMKPGTFVSLLNLCCSKEESGQLHARILKNGHQSHLSVSNALISTYANSESMEDAGKLFDEMPERDIISWTAIISGHTQNSKFDEVLRIIHSFIGKRITPDTHALTAIVNACRATRAPRLGKQCHALALTLDVDFSGHLSPSFIHMYSKCGDVDQAAKLFYSLPSPRGVVPTNAMLAGYNWNSMQEKGIDFFCSERGVSFLPDEFTFSSLLDACSDLRLPKTGCQLHSVIIKMGFESFDVIIGNALIKLYMKSGYVENARRSFSQMHRNGLFMNPVALSGVIRCCMDSLDLRLGKQVHALVLKTGFSSDNLVSSSVMGIYEKSMGVEGLVVSGNEALTVVNARWSSRMGIYENSTCVEGSLKGENEALTGVNTLWRSILVEFFRKVEELQGCNERLPEAVRSLKVVEPFLFCQSYEVQNKLTIPVFCFVDLPKIGLFHARHMKGQRGLTPGSQPGSKVKLSTQLCVLDESPPLTFLLCVNTSGLVSGVFLGQTKSVQYVDFHMRLYQGMKKGEELR